MEDWCNRAAAEFLVPSSELRKRWLHVRRKQRPFEALGRSFKVSPVVAARRALDLRLVDRSAFIELYEHYVSQERLSGAEPSRPEF